MWPFAPRWMTWAFAERRFKKLGFPERWAQDPDRRLLDRRFKAFERFQSKLWRQHLSALPRAERDALNATKHPSQSHARAAEAEPYAQALGKALEQRGVRYVKGVELGYQQLDILLLVIILARDPGREIIVRDLPYLWRGFQTRWRIEEEHKHEE